MGTEHRRRGRTVLLADDDPEYVDAMRRLLEGEGYRVVAASNGAQALACALLEPPDIVLLDQRMPGMNGTQVNRALVAAGIRRPVVLISGRDDAARLSRSSGARYWLPKPFEVEQLLSTMERALADAATA